MSPLANFLASGILKLREKLDNDANVHAPFDAQRLAARLQGALS